MISALALLVGRLAGASMTICLSFVRSSWISSFLKHKTSNSSSDSRGFQTTL